MYLICVNSSSIKTLNQIPSAQSATEEIKSERGRDFFRKTLEKILEFAHACADLDVMPETAGRVRRCAGLRLGGAKAMKLRFVDNT